MKTVCILIGVLSCLFTSCAITKRQHLPGWHVEWKYKQHSNASGQRVDKWEASSDDAKRVMSDDLKQETSNIRYFPSEKDSLVTFDKVDFSYDAAISAPILAGKQYAAPHGLQFQLIDTSDVSEKATPKNRSKTVAGIFALAGTAMMLTGAFLAHEGVAFEAAAMIAGFGSIMMLVGLVLLITLFAYSKGIARAKADQQAVVNNQRPAESQITPSEKKVDPFVAYEKESKRMRIGLLVLLALLVLGCTLFYLANKLVFLPWIILPIGIFMLLLWARKRKARSLLPETE